jgi:hypothetical protein
LKAREERIRDLGGLTLEMYRRSSFRDELLIEQCREIVALEERVQELDSMLSAVAATTSASSAGQTQSPGYQPSRRRQAEPRTGRRPVVAGSRNPHSRQYSCPSA